MKHAENSNKHLTLEDRITIQNLLDSNVNLTTIGKALGKHRTTISKEIKLHKHSRNGISSSISKLRCARHQTCTAFSSSCSLSCSRYEEPTCERLTRSPFVCNGCPEKNKCRHTRWFYTASLAHKEYLYMLSDSRSGILLPQEDFAAIEEVITPLIVEQGQSINQVFINHPDILHFSKPTFYKYINEGILTTRNIDLPRKVKYKSRKKNTSLEFRESSARTNRTYEDYQMYMASHPLANLVQMDTVIGTKGSKGGTCFLTLLFVRCCFMLIIPLPYKRMEYVTEAFLWLRKTLGNEEYHRLFEVILTDNGSEFFDPISIEVDMETGEKRTHVFYCNPQAAWQKGALEKNHEYIRYIFPKGTSFAGMTYEKCALLSSHINSVPRISLNNRTPFDVAEILLGINTINKLGIKRIEADDVRLNSSLFNN